MDNQIVPQDQNGAPPAVFGQAVLGLGNDPVDVADIIIPRAKVIQFTSAEAQEVDPTLRVAPGSLINNLTRKVIGNTFVPVYQWVSFTCWNPRKTDDPNFNRDFGPGEIVFSTNDATDPRVLAGVKFIDGNPPSVTRYQNYLCYFPGEIMPMILSFAKTSAKAGQKLNTFRLMFGGDIFARQYELIVTLKEGDSGKYFVLDVADLGPSTAEQKKVAHSWFTMFGHKAKEQASTPEPSAGFDE
jgi:hypothetical protein